MNKLILLSSISMISLMGCSNQLAQYVSVAKPPALEDQPVSAPGSLELEGKLGVKFSPGHIIGAGSTVGIRAGVTVSQQAGVGDTVGIRFGISRAPANQ